MGCARPWAGRPGRDSTGPNAKACWTLVDVSESRADLILEVGTRHTLGTAHLNTRHADPRTSQDPAVTAHATFSYHGPSSPPLEQLLRLQPAQIAPLQAVRLAAALNSLAAWWLAPDVLASAEALVEQTWPDPAVPGSRGACWFALVNSGWPALRPALLWPLEWREHPQHDPGLAPQLIQLANLVVDQLKQPGWTLHQLKRFALPEPILTALARNSDFSSAWAGLAASLEVAVTGADPDPYVWVTGCWDPQRGLQPVHGLVEKLRLAERHNVKEFFVPAEQLDEASRIVASGGNSLTIGQLRTGTTNPRDALRPLLLRLRARPQPPSNEDDEAAFQACIEYYNSQSLDERTYAFYETHLLPTVSARLKRYIQQQWPGWSPTHLVTIVSRHRELAMLAALALQVRHVLLFYTDAPPTNDQTQDMEHVRARLQDHGVQCTPVAFRDDASLQATLTERLMQFLDRVQPECAVVDLTPGTKLMSLCLAFSAPAGSWLLYLQHQTRPVGDRRPIPGTERYLRWDARADTKPAL